MDMNRQHFRRVRQIKLKLHIDNLVKIGYKYVFCPEELCVPEQLIYNESFLAMDLKSAEKELVRIKGTIKGCYLSKLEDVLN